MGFRELPGSVLMTCEKGDVLIRQGEPVTHVYYLIRGTVYREVITLEGYECIPGVKTAAATGLESVVGILALFTENDHLASNSSFIAQTTCTCYKIPREPVLNHLRKDPDLLIQVIKLAMKEQQNLFQLMMMKNEGQVANRLCKILLERSAIRDGKCVVMGKCLNIELSKFLSVHKVTIARILKQLRQERIIEKVGSVVEILDCGKLQEYAECKKQLKYH